MTNFCTVRIVFKISILCMRLYSFIVSICLSCSDDEEESRGVSSSSNTINNNIGRGNHEELVDFDSDNSQESESDDGDFYSDGEDEVDGENQVVPWSAISSSYSKRHRDFDDDHFESEEEEEDGSCSNRSSELCLSGFKYAESESDYELSRPLKLQRTEGYPTTSQLTTTTEDDVLTPTEMYGAKV